MSELLSNEAVSRAARCGSSEEGRSVRHPGHSCELVNRGQQERRGSVVDALVDRDDWKAGRSVKLAPIGWADDSDFAGMVVEEEGCGERQRGPAPRTRSENERMTLARFRVAKNLFASR